MLQIKGIDVSSWQGNIAWDKVAKTDVKFAIIRTGAGKRIEGLFVKNIENAIKNGIDCGVYHYSMATTVDEAVNEAKMVLNAIKPYKIVYPVVYDIEDKVHHLLSNSERTKLVKAFCDTIIKGGYKTAVYTSLYWMNSMLDLSKLENYDKWVAQWGVEKCSFTASSLDMWQHSSKGRVDGITGEVDLNICYKDYNAISLSPKPPHKEEISQGKMLKLEKTPLFISSTAKNKAGLISGSYWLYDTTVNNGRIRITNSVSRVGKKPMVFNVTGYIDKTDI
ncbi:MAG: glycoside hydrolase family 25 protein [Oscillospiraceae bacterium]